MIQVHDTWLRSLDQKFYYSMYLWKVHYESQERSILMNAYKNEGWIKMDEWFSLDMITDNIYIYYVNIFHWFKFSIVYNKINFYN